MIELIKGLALRTALSYVRMHVIFEKQALIKFFLIVEFF